VTFPDPDHLVGESRYVIIGLSRFGQCLTVAHTDRREKVRIISARKATVRNGDFMKKEADSEMDDDLRPEYDFSQLARGVQGKYVERYRSGTNLVLLDADVAKAFPNEDAVNGALRLLMQIAQRQPANNPVGADE
jgi:Ribonuclease toxin, BrnT, of type II toxin-antitoxin system